MKTKKFKMLLLTMAIIIFSVGAFSANAQRSSNNRVVERQITNTQEQKTILEREKKILEFSEKIDLLHDLNRQFFRIITDCKEYIKTMFEDYKNTKKDYEKKIKQKKIEGLKFTSKLKKLENTTNDENIQKDKEIIFYIEEKIEKLKKNFNQFHDNSAFEKHSNKLNKLRKVLKSKGKEYKETVKNFMEEEIEEIKNEIKNYKEDTEFMKRYFERTKKEKKEEIKGYSGKIFLNNKKIQHLEAEINNLYKS